MDRCRLKNIIILILVLVNVFLMASLAQRRGAERDSFRRTAEQLVALYQEDGMSLEPRAISQDSPTGGVLLTRDTVLEERAAAFLLGNDPSASDQGGGIFHYTGAAGEAFFRSNGGFEASGVLADDDVENFCQDFCRAFSYESPEILLDETGGGVFSAVCLHAGLPVFNASVTFTVKNHVLTAVSGTLLPKSGAPAPGEQPLSAAGALIAFQQMRRESAVVASAVIGTHLCYELQSGGSALSLAPVWQIVTDMENYYVNCYTGTVSGAGGTHTGEAPP